MTPNRPLVLLIAFALIAGSTFAASFSPANWPADERAALERLEERNTPDAYRVVEGDNGLVAGTMSPTSVRVGLDVLKQGGNAADAATAVAVTQVARSLGSFVSYAGIAQILYLDARSGKVYSLDAGWASYLGEADPKTIPVIATRNDKPVLAVAVTGPILHDTVTMVPGLPGCKADAKTLMTAPPP